MAKSEIQSQWLDFSGSQLVETTLGPCCLEIEISCERDAAPQVYLNLRFEEVPMRSTAVRLHLEDSDGDLLNRIVLDGLLEGVISEP